jgi:REP element-mobilizing transposase RayT
MKYNPKNHHRHSIRLEGYDYWEPNWYYVTICTQNKQCLFGEIKNGKMILNEYGKIIEEELLKTKEIRKNVDLDYYVIMPDHIHVIIIIERKIGKNIVGATRRVAPTLQSNSLGAIIGQFKSMVTKRINEKRNTPGYPVWQRNYYEHILRNERDLYCTRNYIELNPLKWELDELHGNN